MTMNIVLWLLQVLLALVFAFFGVQHILLRPDLAEGLAWMYDISPVFNRVIGVAELAAVMGLILPGLTKIQTRLTPLAAAGLMLVMVGAFIFNVTSGVIGNAVSNVILLVLAAAVAYLRWRVRPLKDRGAAG